MIEHEVSDRKRIVFENEDFVAFCPFASRLAFEVWVLPESTSLILNGPPGREIKAGRGFPEGMKAIFQALNDRRIIFYIHTSPCDGKDYLIITGMSRFCAYLDLAGFELETGIEISSIQPEVAAEYLRKML